MKIIDETQYGCRLGIQEMPPGYRLDRLDSGHYYWVLEVGEPDKDGIRDHEIESGIHWDRWAVYRGAWAHYTDIRR